MASQLSIMKKTNNCLDETIHIMFEHTYTSMTIEIK